MTANELILKARKGDTDALTALLREQEPGLRLEIAPQIPQRWQALLSVEDVLQETFTDAFLCIADFEPRGPTALKNWLVTIARHNLLGAIQSLEAEKRGGRARKPVSIDLESSCVTLFSMLTHSLTTPSGDAARQEAKGLIEAAIEKLPADFRLVIQMYDLEGHPAADVATTLKRTQGAVFMLRARAHRTLRSILGVPQQYFTDFA